MTTGTQAAAYESDTVRRARLALEAADDDYEYALELAAEDDPGMPARRVDELAQLVTDLEGAYVRAVDEDEWLIVARSYGTTIAEARRLASWAADEMADLPECAS